MFGVLFRQAQATVDNAIAHVVNRLIIVVPLVVSAGFATAALSSWLTRHLGPEMANLSIAGGYAGLAAIAALAVSRAGEAAETGAKPAPTLENEGAAEARSAEAAGQSADRELLATALSSAAPLALPVLVRLLLRNLPLVLLALVGAFFMMGQSRDESESELSDPLPEPAE